MFKSRIILFLVAAIIVVGAVASAIYFGAATTQSNAPAAVEQAFVPQAAQAPAALPATGAIRAPRSLYVTEAELKSDINAAAERHWDEQATALLDKLNGRYLRRVHLPW